MTLDKMVAEFKDKKERNVTHTIKTPTDIQELKSQLSSLQTNSAGHFIVSDIVEAKPSFFTKVKSIFTKKK